MVARHAIRDNNPAGKSRRYSDIPAALITVISLSADILEKIINDDNSIANGADTVRKEGERKKSNFPMVRREAFWFKSRFVRKFILSSTRVKKRKNMARLKTFICSVIMYLSRTRMGKNDSIILVETWLKI